MSDLPDELPSDPAELRAFAAALLDRCARLERLLKLAKDAQFGRSSETLDADQLQLVLEDIEEAVAALEAAEDRVNPRTSEKRAAERRTNRGQLPEHLPRISKPCCRLKPVARPARAISLRLVAMKVRGSTSFRYNTE
ncbi:hypothetical protein ACVIM9_007170 [Bradyrhizobium sp. USDA 4520]